MRSVGRRRRLHPVLSRCRIQSSRIHLAVRVDIVERMAYPASSSLFLRTQMAQGRAALALRAARGVASSSPFPAAPAAAPAVAPSAELKWAVHFSRTHQNSGAGGAEPHRSSTAAAAAAAVVGYPAPPLHHVQQRRGLAAGATSGSGGAATGADTGPARRATATTPGKSNNCAKQIGPVTLNFSKLVKPGEGPLAAYERLSKDGTLRWDAAQHSALEAGPHSFHFQVLTTNL